MTQINPVGANPITVPNGGTGAATLTSGGILIGAGTGAVSATLSPTGITALTATTLHGTTIDTNVAAAQLSLNGTTLDATGSNAAVGLALTTKGAGVIVYSQSKAGIDQNIQITNSDNTAANGRAGLQLAVGGATSTGDPYVNFLVSGAGQFTMGVDNSVSDNFTLSASAALGTTDVMRVTAAGSVTKPLSPSFLLNQGSGQADKTGNGASYTIGTGATLTVVYDQQSNATTSGVFTAPVTGIYDLRACVRVSGMAAATADTMTLNIVTTARTYTKTNKFLGALTTQSIDLCVLANMTATDTATVTIVVSGEAGDTADIDGAAGPVTFFCGSLVA